MNVPLLSVLIFLPLVGAAAAGLADRRREALLRWIGLGTALATLAVAVVVAARFVPGTDAMQFEERAVWVEGAGIGYHVGVDGIALPLVLLTAVMLPLGLLSSWGSVTERVKEFTVSMLILETALLGTFLSLDLVLFYVFWDAVLVPMYFIIGLWGGPRRAYAAVKFILYTMAGSALMLIAIIALWVYSGTALGARTFDLVALRAVTPPMPLQAWLFAAFALAFAGCLVVIPSTFIFTSSPLTALGFFAAMGFMLLYLLSGCAVYFPELFPTRLRATGTGFCYNAARYLSAPSPALFGQLSALLGLQ